MVKINKISVPIFMNLFLDSNPGMNISWHRPTVITNDMKYLIGFFIYCFFNP